MRISAFLLNPRRHQTTPGPFPSKNGSDCIPGAGIPGEVSDCTTVKLHHRASRFAQLSRCAVDQQGCSPVGVFLPPIVSEGRWRNRHFSLKSDLSKSHPQSLRLFAGDIKKE